MTCSYVPLTNVWHIRKASSSYLAPPNLCCHVAKKDAAQIAELQHCLAEATEALAMEAKKTHAAQVLLALGAQ